MEHHSSLNNLSDNDKENISSCLVKIDAHQSPSTGEAENALQSLLRIGTTIQDMNLVEKFTKILAAANDASPQETECLQFINQSYQKINDISRPEYYVPIVKLMHKLEHKIYNVFSFSNNLKQFFTALKEDRDFQKLLELSKQLTLSDEHITELLKAEYRPNDFNNHYRDELIRKLDENRKLPQLPEKSFQVLMNHIGKKLGLNDHDIQQQLMPLERRNDAIDNQQQSHVEALFRVIKSQYDIQSLPKKSREALQAKWQKLQQHNMLEYVKMLKAPDPHSQERMAKYQELLISIAQGNNPDDSQLAMLDSLHREFFGETIPDAMPNRSQAFLENYQTQQEIKKSTPDKQYMTQIFQKARDEKPLELMEAVELNIYLTNNGNIIPHDINRQIRNYLARQYQDIYQTARTEFVDDKALAVIRQVIEQIRREEYRLSKQEIYVPELDAYLKQTSDFMELRFKNSVKAIKKELDKAKDTDVFSNPHHAFWQKRQFNIHEGLDFTALDDHTGIITYQYGFDNKPDIAEIVRVDSSVTKGRTTKDITILEYHPNHGALLTIIRHIQIEHPLIHAISLYKLLDKGDKVGTYQLPEDSNKKEHAHIERYHAKMETLQKFLNDKQELKLNAFVAEFRSSYNNNNADDDVARLVQPIKDGNDYHAIALFTPNSALNKQLLASMKEKWLNHTENLLTSGQLQVRQSDGEIDTEKTVILVMDYIRNSIIRDRLKLDIIVEMLLKIQLLLQKIGQPHGELDNVIHYAKQTSIELREQHTPKKFRIAS